MTVNWELSWAVDSLVPTDDLSTWLGLLPSWWFRSKRECPKWKNSRHMDRSCKVSYSLDLEVMSMTSITFTGTCQSQLEENQRNSETFLNITNVQLVFKLPHLNDGFYTSSVQSRIKMRSILHLVDKTFILLTQDTPFLILCLKLTCPADFPTAWVLLPASSGSSVPVTFSPYKTVRFRSSIQFRSMILVVTLHRWWCGLFIASHQEAQNQFVSLWWS